MVSNTTKSDGELLRHYIRDGCESAFSHLGRRYAGLVYSSCLRELHDAALAEDAAQTTFLLLAQNAASLTHYRSLAGWLFNTARLVSQNLRRQELRRKIYEERAAQNMSGVQKQETENRLWEMIEPHINDALAELKPADQEAILIRFFEGKSLAETGSRLGVAENTARMRVRRALERIRLHLRKVGIVAPIAILSLILTEHGAQAATATVYEAIERIAVSESGVISGVAAGQAAPASVSSLTKGAIQIMAIMTTKKIGIGAGIALLALVCGGVAVVQVAPSNTFAQLFQKAEDPAAKRVASVLTGHWEGVQESFIPSNGQWSQQNRQLTMTPITNGIKAVVPGSGEQTYVFDTAANICTQASAQGTFRYKAEGLQELAKTGQGTLILSAINPDPKIGDLRVSLTITPDQMTLANATRVEGVYQVREHQTLRRVSEPNSTTVRN